MTPNDVLAEVDALLRKVAADTTSVVGEADPGWESFLVSVRWEGEHGAFDVIIESTRGAEKKYHSPHGQTSGDLILLWRVSRQFQPAWVELLLTVAADGSCQTQFGYD